MIRHRFRRNAFTIIELQMILAAGVVLVSMILPAVQKHA